MSDDELLFFGHERKLRYLPWRAPQLNLHAARAVRREEIRLGRSRSRRKNKTRSSLVYALNEPSHLFGTVWADKLLSRSILHVRRNVMRVRFIQSKQQEIRCWGAHRTPPVTRSLLWAPAEAIFACP